MTELYDEAQQVLDTFLFEDILNNRNYSEDSWDITWKGDEFLLLHRKSGKMINLSVVIEPGNLSEDEKIELANDQEWFDG
jgi:hypothetical protein